MRVQGIVLDSPRWHAVLLGGYRGLDLEVDVWGVCSPIDSLHASRDAGPEEFSH